jgi:uncharacterized protein
MTAESGVRGPVIWLTACCHGDEVGGIVVVQEIFRIIRKTGLLRGSLHAFPLMNPIGFETMSRHIPYSREDLNRSFPGNPAGTLGERIAFIIFDKITQTLPDLVIDLHTDWTRSIPYALIDAAPEGSGKDAPGYGDTYCKMASIALECGLPVIRDTEMLPRSLSQNLLKRGICSLTLELGESFVINEKNIDTGVTALYGLLARFMMVAPTEKLRLKSTESFSPDIAGRILDYRHHPYSSSSGIIRFLLKPGDMVHPGKPVARIYNAFGKLIETMRSPYSGIILGHADSSMGYPGMPVMAFGTFIPDRSSSSSKNQPPDL